jgi:polyphosphate kinase
MERNMFRRVEIAFPIVNPRLAKRVYRDLLFYLKDNTQAWVLQPDGTYERAVPPPDVAPFSAQQALLDALAEQS